MPHKRGKREQREKEEWEERLFQKAKREKEEKERNIELVSNLTVQFWELYRCKRVWMRKPDKFDSVKRTADFDREIETRSATGPMRRT